MSRFEKWSVWLTTLLTAGTGIGFFWAKYLTVSDDPFSVIHHPLQPVFLKLHILVAPLFLLALGSVAVQHIWRHIRSGVRWSRKAGLTTALAAGPMILTGYLIQVLTGEGWLQAMAFSHIGFGLLYLVGISLHQWFLRRPAPAADALREAEAEPDTPRLAVVGGGVARRGTAAARPRMAPRPAWRTRQAGEGMQRAPLGGQKPRIQEDET
ncbi:MAG: hypothetical protein ACE5HP_11515 [Gemmatimonadota bacterium]